MMRWPLLETLLAACALAGNSEAAALQVDVNRLEAQLRGGQDSYVWDGAARWGGEADAAVFKAEGSGGFGGAVESADFRLLWSHALSPRFDARAGLRHDLRPKPQRTHLVLGLNGAAPLRLDVETNLFLSDKGDLTGELEITRDMGLTANSSSSRAVKSASPRRMCRSWASAPASPPSKQAHGCATPSHRNSRPMWAWNTSACAATRAASPALRGKTPAAGPSCWA